MEEWRSIPGYEGQYEVSNMGRVRSLPHRRKGGNQFGCSFETVLPGKILTPQPRRKYGRDEVGGHLRVTLSRDGKAHKIFIHRLVAQTFIPNPNNYPIVNHKDENPQNNNVENLEWCSYEYNQNYGTCRKRMLGHTNYKKRSEQQHKKIYQYSMDGILVKIWNSRKEAIEAGYTGTAITRCAQGKRNKHKGYIWSYHERFFGVGSNGMV